MKNGLRNRSSKELSTKGNERKVEKRIAIAEANDQSLICDLFDRIIKFRKSKGHVVWESIDTETIEKDIELERLFKILCEERLIGVFTVQFEDPLIWCKSDYPNAIYLHRIAIDPEFGGGGMMQLVIDFTKQIALSKQLSFIRMDTWVSNRRLIEYYQRFGFSITGFTTTPNVPELPLQNRAQHVALLQLSIAND